MAAVKPSLPGVVPHGSAVDKAAAAALVLAAISVLMAGVVSEVTLTAPPPPVAVEEERETELPASPGGGLHSSPSRSEPKALRGDVAGTESERPAVAHATEVVDIPSDNEANDMVELLVSLWELAVVQSEAGPSGGLLVGDLEWPCPKDPPKVRFVLRDS